jgi:hypothetical protein
MLVGAKLALVGKAREKVFSLGVLGVAEARCY